MPYVLFNVTVLFWVARSVRMQVSCLKCVSSQCRRVVVRLRAGRVAVADFSAAIIADSIPPSDGGIFISRHNFSSFFYPREQEDDEQYPHRT